MSDTKMPVLTELELGLVSGGATVLNTKSHKEVPGFTNAGKKPPALQHGPFVLVAMPA